MGGDSKKPKGEEKKPGKFNKFQDKFGDSKKPKVDEKKPEKKPADQPKDKGVSPVVDDKLGKKPEDEVIAPAGEEPVEKPTDSDISDKDKPQGKPEEKKPGKGKPE